MDYQREQLEGYSPGLRALLYKQDRIKPVIRKTPEYETLIYKIMQVSKEENEIFVYTCIMLEGMYYFCEYNSIKGIRFAEVFLREGNKLMEEGLFAERYPTYAMRNYIGVFDYVFLIFMRFYQITNKKMEYFFDIFRKSIRAYGHEWRYYHSRLIWEILCRDKQGATAAYKSFNSYSIDPIQCYICLRKPVVWYYILMEDYDKVMEQCLDFISGNIPREYMGRYETCESANSYDQYMMVFFRSLEYEKGEMLTRILPLLYSEIREFPEEHQVDCNEALVFALYDDFVHWKNHMKEAVWELEVGKDTSPHNYMYACLKWMVYLIRLSHSGVEWVDFATEEPLPLLVSGEGQYSVPELAAYFEKQADEIGEKFDESRKGFSYCKRKEFFLELSKSPQRYIGGFKEKVM